MIQVQYFTFNGFQENTYVLSDESKQCIIIDPGCGTMNERRMLDEYIKKQDLTPTRLINTHCHIDHVLGNAYVAEKYKLGLEIHENELKNLKASPGYASVFGMECEASPEPSNFLEEGDQLVFGLSSLDIIFTPGHSPGSVSFYSAIDHFIVAGDVLFRESIGRADLPGGNLSTLLQSISNKLFTLPSNTIVYSGHGGPTTIEHEMKYNPFFVQP